MQLQIIERPEFQIEVPDLILNAGVFEAKHRTELFAQFAKKRQNFDLKVEVASSKC